MRYCLFSLVLAIFVVAIGDAQEKKKKPKEGDKSSVPEVKEVTEVAGKGLDQWIKEIHSTDPTRREIGMKMVLGFGPDKAYTAVPDILTDLEKHKKVTQDLSVRVNGTLAISAIFKYMYLNKKEPEPAHVKRAVAMFNLFLADSQVILRVRTVQETRNEKTVNEVIKIVNDPATWEARQAGIQTVAILAYDDKKLPAPTVMIALYKRSDKETENSSLVRLAAVNAIAQLGSGVAEQKYKHGMIGKLYTPFKDESPTVRYAAVQAIASLGVTAPQTERSLIITEFYKRLGKGDLPSVRYTTVQALAHLAIGAPPLEKGKAHEKLNAIDKARLFDNLNLVAAKDADASVKCAAHLAIMSIRDSVAKDHVDPICNLAKQGEPLQKIVALQHLSMLGPVKGKLAVPCVTEAIHDSDVNVAVTAMLTLIHLKASSAIYDLKKIKDDVKANPVLRKGAEEAIDEIEYLIKEDEKKDKEKKDKKDKK